MPDGQEKEPPDLRTELELGDGPSPNIRSESNLRSEPVQIRSEIKNFWQIKDIQECQTVTWSDTIEHIGAQVNDLESQLESVGSAESESQNIDISGLVEKVSSSDKVRHEEQLREIRQQNELLRNVEGSIRSQRRAQRVGQGLSVGSMILILVTVPPTVYMATSRLYYAIGVFAIALGFVILSVYPLYQNR